MDWKGGPGEVCKVKEEKIFGGKNELRVTEIVTKRLRGWEVANARNIFMRPLHLHFLKLLRIYYAEKYATESNPLRQSLRFPSSSIDLPVEFYTDFSLSLVWHRFQILLREKRRK